MKEKILEIADELTKTDDIYYFKDDTNAYVFELNDCYGYDSEKDTIIDRYYENEELVNTLIEFLDDNCIKKEDSFIYKNYFFDDCIIRLGYTSFGI